ncbi:MAG: DUF1330 domain-containing protein [Pseudomonadota bacterium]
MQVINQIVPTDPEQIQKMAEPGPEGPIFMVNLLKFKSKADYEDGRETDLTGREAYQLYGMGVAGLLPEFGARIFFVADVTFLSLGQVEDLWDEVAIAVYPNRAALFKMTSSETWQALAVHREAGLAGQLNIESVMPAHGQALPWMQLLLNDLDV